ncbi:pyridoxamine 5'-phosphate oxidase [Candidatus Riesia sp. GBBU]|nr:pyridoxamine 5'-phosphate oxidase [Candidatus Riesia sp. GBBU]
MKTKTNLYINEVRNEYSQKELRRKDLTIDPIELFEKWLQQAENFGVTYPNAMCVSTSDTSGNSYQRTVFLRYFDENGLIFYTNLFSRKAKQIKNNSKVSLLFPWFQMERQVCFLGVANKISSQESIKYFHSRPRDNQIASWASKQSKKISSKKVLIDSFLFYSKKFKNYSIPFPIFWGGYIVKFNMVEFWQGGIKRLHDRFLYERNKKEWKVDRLSP